MSQDIQQLFNIISEKELNDEVDISSFDNMPYLFHNILTSTFGLSSNIHKNPFFEIKKIAMNKNNLWEDRIQAVRYMQRIPHIYRGENCIEALLSIISDDKYPIHDRYTFFSNNERIIKLDYDLVNAGHRYIIDNFIPDNKNIPLIYIILSAQFALTQFPVDTFDLDKVQNYLINIAKNKDMEINYRAECADILDRTGYGEVRNIGKEVIKELGELYIKNQLKTIYTNSQNVHDDTINKQIIDTLRTLISTTKTTRNSDEIYNLIINKVRSEVLQKSFQRILIDTAKYEGLSMVDILLLVWEKIQTSEQKDILQTRLIDELSEMNETCSTGHLSRLLNVLSGFFNNIQPVKISYKEQLRANIFARYSSIMKTISKLEQEIILNEMITNDKSTIKEFIISYSPNEELEEEFVTNGYITKEDFDVVYTKGENDFFGIC